MDGKRPTHIRLTVLFFAVATITGIAVLAGSDGFSQSTATIISVAKMDIGSAPADFEFARTGYGGPGRWAVVRDTTALADRAIEQTSADRTDYRFPLAIYKPISAKNVDVSIRFKAVAGRVDQAGGVAVRVIDSDNYYVVRANALEDNVRFYRLVKGRREQIGGVNTKVSASEWHTIGLKAEGEQFTVTFDGKSLFTAADRTFARAGKIALWTKADSVMRFDRIEINVLP